MDPNRPLDYLPECCRCHERREEKHAGKDGIEADPKGKVKDPAWKGTKGGKRGISSVILLHWIGINFLGVCLHPTMSSSKQRLYVIYLCVFRRKYISDIFHDSNHKMFI